MTTSSKRHGCVLKRKLINKEIIFEIQGAFRQVNWANSERLVTSEAEQQCIVPHYVCC